MWKERIGSICVMVFFGLVVVFVFFAFFLAMMMDVDAAMPMPCPQPAPPGLVAHYKMDDNAASSVVVDSAGSNNGTWVGTGGADDYTDAHTTTTAKVGGRALVFDGADDIVACGTNSVLMPDSWTIAFWRFQVSEVASTNLFASWRTGYPGIIEAQNGSLITIQMNNGNIISFSDILSSPIGDWEHIAVSIPGASQTDVLSGDAFSNGGNANKSVLQSQTTTAQLSKVTFVIGGSTGNATFDGIVNDFRLYNRQLSRAEVYYLYNSGNGRTY